MPTHPAYGDTPLRSEVTGSERAEGARRPLQRLPLTDNLKITKSMPGPAGPFPHGALGLDGCLSLTTGVHRVRFPAGAPDPRVGLLMAGHHRDGSPTCRVSTAPRAGDRGQEVNWV